MQPSMYCGASSHHIHSENFEFKNDEQLLVFGRDKADEKTTWLDINNCTGIITPTTFTLWPALNYINFSGCTLEISPKAFSTIKNLRSIDMRKSTISITKEMFEGSDILEHLSLYDLKLPDDDCLSHLKNLNMLNLQNCEIENDNGNIFKNLHKLQYLIIDGCQLTALGNIYKEMENLEHLTIMGNKIGGEFDCNGLLELKKLERLCIFNNQTSSNISYEDFQNISSLQTILFDTQVYKNTDFRAFPNLKTVEIGTLTDEITEEERELMNKLESMNIVYQYTFCGKIEVDMSKVQICA